MPKKATSAITPAFLPAPATLIGRDREVATALDLVGGSTIRILTLVGPGGIGKTAIAKEVARLASSQLSVTVQFTTFEDVVESASSALRLKRRIIQLHSSSIKGSDFPARRSLLVLDAFETVIEAAAVLPQLLAQFPELDFLVTSRSALRLQQEHCLPIQPLAIPALPLADPVDLDSVAEYGAVALFVERARSIVPAFSITRENVEAIVTTCINLDGVPLGIELAARQLWALPIEALPFRLEDGISLLAMGSRDSPKRHQSLRTAIDSTYSQVPERFQRVLRIMSVFENGLDLEEVYVLGAYLGEERGSFGNHIAMLVEISLLRTEFGPDNSVRYLMLRSVREVAGEQLIAMGEADWAFEVHARVIAAFAETAARDFLGPNLSHWFRRLDLSADDIRRAVLWSIENEAEAAIAFRLAGALWRYWLPRWHRSAKRQEIVELIEPLPERFPAASDEPGSLDRANLLFSLGMLALYQMQFDKAERYLDASLEASRIAGNPLHYATTSIYWARFAQMRGLAEARPALVNAIGLMRLHRNPWFLALALDALALVSANEYDYETAHRSLDESEQLFADLGNLWGKSIVLRSRACVEFLEGNDLQSVQLLEQCLSIQQSLRDNWSVSMTQGLIDRLLSYTSSKVGVSQASPPRQLPVKIEQSAFEREFQVQVPLFVPLRMLRTITMGRAEDTSSLNAMTTQARLTKREWEVIGILTAGNSNADIAKALGVTVHTVARHLIHIFQKLGAHNRVEVASFGIQHGIPPAKGVRRPPGGELNRVRRQ